jgi:pyridoxamine 5'-phosphate oxidase
MIYSYLTYLPWEPPPEDRAEEEPWEVFSYWYAEAQQSGMKEPSAVCLATASRCGAPSCRMVLLKDFNARGFVFYTNAQSRKGRELEQNPQAALCFYWPEIGKQVRVEGSITRVSDAEADAYFSSRSLPSRIGAWASQQSRPMKHRSELLGRIAAYTAKWAMGEVQRPPHWTGFRLVPDYVEFWTEGAHRIHDRRVYYLREELWYIATLQP